MPAQSGVDLRQIADALETAYGCLTLVREGVHITDLSECMAEVKAARDKVWNLLEAGQL